MTRSKEETGSAKPSAYLLHFEARYNPAKSDPPRLARLALTSNRLRRAPVEFPKVAAGHLAVRGEGTYAAHDGDVFECVESSHAEIFVVHRGFQFAIWWACPRKFVRASLAKAGFLARTTRGETLIITRHGRAIARIVPEVNRRQEEVDRALASIRELRKRTGKVTLEELRSARDEGRKY